MNGPAAWPMRLAVFSSETGNSSVAVPIAVRRSGSTLRGGDPGSTNHERPDVTVGDVLMVLVVPGRPGGDALIKICFIRHSDLTLSTHADASHG
jgi:hypothetical protein